MIKPLMLLVGNTVLCTVPQVHYPYIQTGVHVSYIVHHHTYVREFDVIWMMVLLLLYHNTKVIIINNEDNITTSSLS